MNVKSWSEGGQTGSCDVRDVNVVECWNEVRITATSALQTHDDYKDMALATLDDLEAQSITVFFPFG